MRFSYPFLRRLGLGAHLVVIVLLAAIPASLLVIGFIDSERREAVEDAQDWAREAAFRAASHHREAISAAQAVLGTASERLDSGAASTPCRIPGNLRRVVWIVAPGGQSACSSDSGFPLPPAIVEEIVSDAAAPGFAIIGPYHVGVTESRIYGALTRDAEGVVWHLIYAIDLHWVPASGIDEMQAAEPVVTVVDTGGEIIHRVGPGADLALTSEAPAWPMIPIETVTDADTPTFVDIDGQTRIVGAASVPETDLTVVVGLSHDAVSAAARREVINSLALFAAVMTLSGLVAWLIIERMILRSVRLLRDAAVATARGEHERRVVVTEGPVELRQLADAFNEMTAKLEFQAFHDQLTGLANRRLIKQRLEAFVRDDTPFALLAIDLDGFKPINDTHGHGIGDQVLAEAAQRLSAGLGQDAFIGRTGGDEFLAMVRTESAQSGRARIAADAASRLLDVLSRPIALDNGIEVTIGGSIGVAFWPDSARSAEEIIREADTALYRAKKSGRNCYVIEGEVGRGTTTAAA